jgi:RNA polymerase sigma-70 factor, ECF subfamily
LTIVLRVTNKKMAVGHTGTTTMELAVDEHFIREHQRMIYSLCYRMTGSVTDAEDLTQETFIAAHQQSPAFKGKSQVSSWLYRIGINRCLNWQKRQQRESKLHRDWGEQRALEGSVDDGTRVTEALMQLAPEERAAVTLVIFEGLKHGEAAAALGCAETTVSWRLFQARRKLKKILGNGEKQ